MPETIPVAQMAKNHLKKFRIECEFLVLDLRETAGLRVLFVVT